MANRFLGSFGQPQVGPFVNQQDMVSQFNACKSDPIQFLSDRGISVPEEYRNNPEQIAKYLMGNTPFVQQNKIFQAVGMIRNMLGFK